MPVFHLKLFVIQCGLDIDQHFQNLDLIHFFKHIPVILLHIDAFLCVRIFRLHLVQNDAKLHTI